MRVRREEMANVVSDVKNRIKTDLCGKLQNFFETHNKTVEEFSHFTQANSNDVRRVLANNADISLDSFIKMMVATGNAIEVRSLVPPHHMERCCHTNPTNRPNTTNCRPIMDGWGRIEEEPQVENDVNECAFKDMDLHTMSREELVNLVCDMGWEEEIDLRRATRSAVINFLSSKQEDLEEEFNDDFDEEECEEVQNYDEETEAERFVRKLSSLFTNNPQLKNEFSRLFGV